MSSNSLYPPPPTLSSKHSGLPERLLGAGTASKTRLLGKRTLPESSPRHGDVPRLPPDTTRAEFDQAINDLKHTLGVEHVEVNDKPLIDGWYVEHP